MKHLAFLLVVVESLACSSARNAVRCADAPPVNGEVLCSVPGWPDRDYLLHLPPAYDGTTAMPVVLAIHGGGGRKENMNGITCEDGDADSANCLSSVADREGFIVVYPDGTPSQLARRMRTWNAGGGDATYKCVSGFACSSGVDDLRYFNDLLDEVAHSVSVDTARVYATGLSNGAAMSHRLACELPDRIAAIAGVGGLNQLAAVQGCSPSRAVPVMQLHGRDDPCWPFEGGVAGCLQRDGLAYVSVDDTIAGTVEKPGWVGRNGCSPDPTSEDLPDTVDDGMRVVRRSWSGCRDGADVVLVIVEGGGHTWPGGDPYLPKRVVGNVTRDVSGSQLIWDFFKAHPKP